MKSRILIVVISLFFVFSCGHQADAGFQDWLKEAAQKLGGEKGPSEDEIVSGLKQALEVGTSNAVKTVSQTNGYFKNPKIRIPWPKKKKRSVRIRPPGLRICSRGYSGVNRRHLI